MIEKLKNRLQINKYFKQKSESSGTDSDRSGSYYDSSVDEYDSQSNESNESIEMQYGNR